MSEPHSDRPVKITAEHRAHPAIRTLARACIALARQLVGEPPSPQAPPRSPAPAGQQPEESAAASGQERPHA
jgi:hypothetical protein